MQRYFVFFSYDGSRYHGWQVQPNGNSVQAELERALSTLLREDVQVVGAGRTDAGVHARMMAAHWDTEAAVDCQQLAYRLNRLLPRDIAVSRVVAVAQDMHARFSATSRTYHYYIHTRKNPFVCNTSCQMHYDLDFELMNEAGRILCTYDDFGAFCKAHTDVKTTLCRVSEARWIQQSPTQWCFRITANRFLRNMVRAVVGTLVEVGRHRMSLDEFRAVVEGKNRMAAGESMPAHALFLEEVRYELGVGC
ncbi:MAG: tRNA pseudouridine(38-40) synthase TruA [Prevotella sp.]|nr:tRNA pseudouridine(38-40) synthase TruA [Prevotella sp.]